MNHTSASVVADVAAVGDVISLVQVDAKCRGAFPCRHDVLVLRRGQKQNQWTSLNGWQIAALQYRLTQDVTQHFAGYHPNGPGDGKRRPAAAAANGNVIEVNADGDDNDGAVSLACSVM